MLQVNDTTLENANASTSVVSRLRTKSRPSNDEDQVATRESHLINQFSGKTRPIKSRSELSFSPDMFLNDLYDYRNISAGSSSHSPKFPQQLAKA